MINKKLGAINHFIDDKFESKKSMNVNMKQHTISKSWTPFEKKLINLTR